MEQTSQDFVSSQPTAASRSSSEPAKTAQQPRTVELFGLPISNISMREALDWITRRARRHEKTLLNFVNAHCVNVASKDPDYHRVLRDSTRLFPDGSGVKMAMAMQGVSLCENLNGTDLFPLLCEEAVRLDLSLFLLGAGPGVAEQVARNMQARYPGLRIVGTQDGFFSAEEEEAVIARINRSRAHILLVAMGVPRQEKWLAKNLQRLDTPVNMGVGGLFDFYAERVSRAPLLLRSSGLEWIWRLLQEPGRMWRRYILGNPAFVLRARRDARHAGLRQTFTERLGRSPTISRWRRLAWRLASRTRDIGKRLLDIGVAGLALLMLSPLFALTALLIKVESKGPVFFSQARVGLRGEIFRFWKFRSMYIDAEQRKDALLAKNEMAGGVLFKMKDDPRITRVGRFIRRYSIDELPQLWNVLRGDMSLVGPRPALPREVLQYRISDRRRLLVKPGITCTWQVSGRSDIPFHEQVRMDVEYMHKTSLSKDIELLVKTVPAVISGRGAY